MHHLEMSVTTHVGVINNRAVFIKKTANSDSSSRLAREASILAEIAGSGVVELANFVEGPSECSLSTYYVGGGTAADLVSQNKISSENVAAMAASLALTLADVHDRGYVHGTLAPHHVLGPISATPLICGWSGAKEIERDAQGHIGDEGPDPHEDVVALARIALELLGGSSDVGAERLKAIFARVGQTGSNNPAGLSMRSMAIALEKLVSDDPKDYPSSFSDVPSSRMVYPRQDSHQTRGRFRWDDRGGFDRFALLGHRLRTAGVGVLALGIVAGGFLFLSSSDSNASSSAASSSDGSSSGEQKPSRVEANEIRAQQISDQRVDDVDSYKVDGRRVIGKNATWEIGAQGDLVFIGDWDGDGFGTPAIVRPKTGEVWVFIKWAESGEQVQAQPVSAEPVVQARSAKVIESSNGLDAIEIQDEAGVTHLVKPQVVKPSVVKP